MLVVSARHVADYFELRRDEQIAMWSLVSEVQRLIQQQHRPAGYNVGFNVSAAGGQTVWHAHVYVIPRYARDVDDPRGGVRWVIGAGAAYWKTSP